MNHTASTYTIPALTGLLGRSPLVRDGEISPVRLADISELDAMTRSGDCFVTLASKLDALSHHIEEYEVQLQLEDIVSDLLYLQENYDVTKKGN